MFPTQTVIPVGRRGRGGRVGVHRHPAARPPV